MHIKKISIITPSLNRRDMLEGVIQNVAAQQYPNFEHIVIDGGSTDGTQDMVKKYPHVHFERESDRGMYDALNKGLDLATGEIIGFLNTDDFYAESIFFSVAANFDDENVMALAGRALVFHKSVGGKTEIIGRYSPQDRTLLECSTIGSNYFNAWFFRRTVFEKIRKFNIEYRIAGDREFMFRFMLNDLCYVNFDELIYKYLQHPGSLTFDNTYEKREWSANEHLLMTSFYLRDNSLAPLIRRFLVKLRTRETTDMVIQSIRTRSFNKSVNYFVEGIKYDFLWPLKFIWRMFLIIANWVVKIAKKTKLIFKHQERT